MFLKTFLLQRKRNVWMFFLFAFGGFWLYGHRLCVVWRGLQYNILDTVAKKWTNLKNFFFDFVEFVGIHSKNQQFPLAILF